MVAYTVMEIWSRLPTPCNCSATIAGDKRSSMARSSVIGRSSFCRATSNSLIALSVLICGCSGSKPADEVAQAPGRPTPTPVAGRSNGGAIAAEPEDGQWGRPAKNYASTRFSGLNEITADNAKNPRLAWTFQARGFGRPDAAPLVGQHTMYNL